MVQLVAGAIAVTGALLSVRLPLVGATLAAASTAVAWGLGLTADPFLLASIGVFTVAERRGSRRFPWWLLAASGMLILTMLIFGAAPNDEGFDVNMRAVVLSIVVTGAAWILGVHTRQARESAAERSRSAERLRLARDVHDVLSHSLSAIGIQAGVSAHVTSFHESDLRLVLREVERQARASLNELRSLLQHERADVDSSSSSLTALLRVVMGPAEQAGLRVELVCPAEIDALSAATRTMIYRVVQEAVTNAIRHAAASALSISIEPRAATVEVTVRDDGRGAPEGFRDGHGLTGMRERVALLGGELRIGTTPEGFSVAACLPLASKEVGSV